MAQPVWVLSVDLQTKTATFQSGMAEAAKSARGAFSDIKSGSGEMGREVGTNMMEARHGVMLLGEEFGVHLPRALTTFIASIGPIGHAMEAAFPFLAIAVGATLLLEHLAKLKEEGQKLTEDQVKFATASQNAFNALDEKLLQAGIKADELNGNHLGALKKQLELIDRQSMAELVHSFETVSKAADVVFKELEGHWYTAGIGSAGAQHALTSFKNEYESLLAQGKDKEAADLLRGTRESAEHILDLQKQYEANQAKTGIGKTTQTGDYGKFISAANELKKLGVGITDKEVQSQQALVDALRAQGEIQERVNALKKQEDSNANLSEKIRGEGEDDKRLSAAIELNRREGKARHAALLERQKDEITLIEQGEKEKIAATDKGSAERLAAIEAAIKTEESYSLQENAFYRDLLLQRVAVEKEMQDEADRQKAEAAREAASNEAKMQELTLAAMKEHETVAASVIRMSMQQKLAEEIEFANRDFAIKLDAYAKEIDALDKHDKDYENKLKAIQDKETQLIRQHENEITTLKEKAEAQQDANTRASLDRMQEALARGLTDTITRHQSMGAMLASIGSEIVSNALQNALLLETVNGRKRLSDARTAATSAYEWGWENGGPAGPFIAPVLAAGAFTVAMAFAEGGLVPGVGRGDIVPAMLTPGEGVIPKKLMDRINDGPATGGGNHYHVHVRPTYNINTIDGDGMRDTLNKHTDVLQRHFENSMRKMNR